VKQKIKLGKSEITPTLEDGQSSQPENEYRRHLKKRQAPKPSLLMLRTPRAVSMKGVGESVEKKKNKRTKGDHHHIGSNTPPGTLRSTGAKTGRERNGGNSRATGFRDRTFLPTNPHEKKKKKRQLTQEKRDIRTNKKRKRRAGRKIRRRTGGRRQGWRRVGETGI